jgi:REP element-mobilizing transposase RayT
MPATDGCVHKHLRRLERIWIDWPIYFITTCTLERRAILGSKEVAAILVDEWRRAHDRHGWAIGRYVIMPDHVHFFCSAELDAKTLPIFMQRWKEWTSKRIVREHAVAGLADPGLKLSGNLWQEEFFDHVLRSAESYGQKWEYVKENPVRAGLVETSDQWAWQGEIESLML